MCTTETGDAKKCDRALRLVDYLSALARIDAKLVRDLEEYKRVVWIHKIPNEANYCFTRAWGTEDESGKDIWIEVNRFDKPLLPQPPAKCLAWVKHETLSDTADLPELSTSIASRREQRDREKGEAFEVPETLNLEDFPEVQKTWDLYLEKQWLPWADLYTRYAAVQKTYEELFQIYLEQQRLGEQHELVLGLGLLTWLTSTGHRVRRHLIVAKATLEYEPHVGRFVVQASTEGPQTRVEFEMLELEQQPPNARELAEEGATKLGEDPWERSAVDPLLRAIANSLAEGREGAYYEDRLQPLFEAASEKPIIEFAPALILRKRSLKSLEQVLASIKERINSGEAIPHGFLDLCESVERGKNGESGPPGATADDQIYFPLPMNEEQRRIVSFLDHWREVLVQGPPGTGKSHTIANLICHLLATGQRVLVTAQTARALQVLHDKLPDEIKPLCINLLGSSTEERQSLEKSVRRIVAAQNSPEAMKVPERVQELEREIRDYQKNKAEIDRKITAIREVETWQHSIADGCYEGTAAGIARKLKEEEKDFIWFEDRIAPDATLALSMQEISNLCRVLADFDLDAERQLEMVIPDPDVDLPGVDTVRDLFRKWRRADEELASKADLLQTVEGRLLVEADTSITAELEKSIGELSAEAEGFRRVPKPWVRKAIDDILSGDERRWEALLDVSTAELDSLRNRETQVETYEVNIPTRLDRVRAIRAAKVIKEHIDTVSFWSRLITPRPVRDSRDLLKGVEVDGRGCSDSRTLKKLIEYLQVEQDLKRFWSRWAGVVRAPAGPLPIQIREIEGILTMLGSLLRLLDLKQKTARLISMVIGLSTPRWTDNQDLFHFIETCRAVLSQHDLESICKQIEVLQETIFRQTERVGTHPIAREIYYAFQGKDVESYNLLVQQARGYRQMSEIVRNKCQAIGKISNAAPKLAEALVRNDERMLWAERLARLPKAWAWARARSWLEDFLNEDLEALGRLSVSLDEDIRRGVANLAAAKAWRFCLSRMQDNHRRHLEAWRQSIRKLGKGTGKHADTHRRDAQRHLNKCRDAVPAWIMPLHRLYETVEGKPEIFDVIIVDEASQCGHGALPLLYLGKRILVVGDDMQISPEAIGVSRELVRRLISDYLPDFSHGDSFDVETSLFDHGRIRFGNRRITLREHFRCVPEIIEFSNELCYFEDPLIPMRQYRANRLEPIKVIPVEEGYREGEDQQVINRPEAEKLAAEVEKCCRDERYQGMSMGVIVLQGMAQAYVIEKLLLERLGPDEMAERNLICGTPYSFQGDERDVIFMSMVAAPNAKIAALTKPPDERRFNVAASRARDQVWLFHSADRNHLSERCLRRRLLEYYKNPKSPRPGPMGDIDELRRKALLSNRAIEKPPHPFESWFELDVALDIANRGYQVVPQYKFADKRIDLVVQGDRAQLAVECYGDHWHGSEHFHEDLLRQRKLERSGWHFFIVRESFYRAAPAKALEHLWKALDERAIYPVRFGGSEGSPEIDETFEAGTCSGEEANAEEVLEENGEEENGRGAQESMAGAEPFLRVGQEDEPRTIQEALGAKRDEIGRTIIEILQERPNHSCVRENMPTYILKRWAVRTRGLPRRKFAKKVDDIIAAMERNGHVSVYKSKNVRIRLGWHRYPGVDVAREIANGPRLASKEEQQE